MDKPSIAVFAPIRDDQISQIKVSAPAYAVIDCRKDVPSDLNTDQIAVSFGVNKNILKKILTSSTSNLKWIQTISAGVDSLDMTLLRKRQILLTNASGIHAVPIAESVAGMLLGYFRGIIPAVRWQTEQTWGKVTDYGELAGKNAIIIGTGHVGQKISAHLTALGVLTTGINSSGHPATGFANTAATSDLPEVLPAFDIVINILPLTKDTYHFYDDQRFAQMKDGVIFVNVGRGKSVDTKSLIQALRLGKVRFAALDVLEEEPLPQENPLWEMDNVLITPHISGLSADFKNRLFDIFDANLAQFVKSQAVCRNMVDLNKGY